MKDNYLLALSLFYRNTKKYFDHHLVSLGLSWGQVLPLLMVNEHNGMSMQELTQKSLVDKGTTSKVVQGLLDSGYLKIMIDEQDHRVKHLYTTSKATEIISIIYHYRQEYSQLLSRKVDFNNFLLQLNQVMDNSENESLAITTNYQSLRIGEYKYLDLANYKGHISATVYLSGCNFKCPFCNKKDLVFIPQDANYLSASDVLNDLKKRKIFLEAVCFSGGEPCLQEALVPFIEEVKKLGYKVKLETNGTFPVMLKKLLQQHLVDYVQLDIKNHWSKLPETVGLWAKDVPLKRIKESIALLKQADVEYELHTTVVKDLHTAEDLKLMKQELAADKHWQIYPFIKSKNILNANLEEWQKEEWRQIKDVTGKKKR